MSIKGFEAQINLKETPNSEKKAEKPLKSENNVTKRVDINILRARAKAIQDKENTKNKFIIIFFVIAFGATGIFFTI